MNCCLKVPAVLQRLQGKLQWLSTSNCLAFRRSSSETVIFLQYLREHTKVTSLGGPTAQLHQWLVTDDKRQYAQRKFTTIFLKTFSQFHAICNFMAF